MSEKNNIPRTRAQGFGAMGMSAFYTTTAATMTEGKAVELLHHVVAQRAAEAVLINSANIYGPFNSEGYGANLRLLRAALAGLPRSSYRLMVKVGMDFRSGKWENKAGTQEGVDEQVSFALANLAPLTDFIDVVVLNRVPRGAGAPSIETVMGFFKAVVERGAARHVALSEATAEEIRRAHSVVPVFAIEQEWSLQERDIEVDIIPTCKELGIPVVAYSPLGRGFLGGDISALAPTDSRHHFPRFRGDNAAANKKRVDALEAISSARGCSVSQLSLAWLYAKAEQLGVVVIPIPGTTKTAHFDSNRAAMDVVLTPAEVEQIDHLFPVHSTLGDRYGDMHSTYQYNKM